MKRAFITVALSALFAVLVLGCRPDAKRSPFSVVGEMPDELSLVSSDSSDAPMIYVGSISLDGDDEIILWTLMNPSMNRSGLGNIKRRELVSEDDEQFCIVPKDDYTPIDNLFIVLTSAKNEELVGYCRVSDAVGTGLEMEHIHTNGTDSPALDDVFVCPTIVAQVDGKYCLVSMVDGSHLIPNSKMAAELTALSVSLPKDPESERVSPDKVVIAFFRIVQKQSGREYSIELLSSLRLKR